MTTFKDELTVRAKMELQELGRTLLSPARAVDSSGFLWCPETHCHRAVSWYPHLSCCSPGLPGTCILVDAATDIFPIWVALMVALKFRKHDVYKFNSGVVQGSRCRRVIR